MHDRENDLAARLQVRFAIDYPTIRVSRRALAAVLRMFPCGGAERASFLAFGRAAGIAAHVPGGDRRQKPSAEKQNKSEANFAVARCVRLNVPVLAVPGYRVRQTAKPLPALESPCFPRLCKVGESYGEVAEWSKARPC